EGDDGAALAAQGSEFFLFVVAGFGVLLEATDGVAEAVAAQVEGAFAGVPEFGGVAEAAGDPVGGEGAEGGGAALAELVAEEGEEAFDGAGILGGCGDEGGEQLIGFEGTAHDLAHGAFGWVAV